MAEEIVEEITKSYKKNLNLVWRMVPDDCYCCT